MQITSHLEEKKILIEQHLHSLIPSELSPYSSLFEAALYSFNTGGKRLRPLLTLVTAEALNADLEASLTPACALEFVHTYSLIHDDLPCMDNDDFRRGKPTLHKVYPEGHAVLTGDFLLTHAFYLLAHAPHLSSDQKVRLTASLAQRAGGHGMIAGQVLDIAFTRKPLTLDLLQLVHQKKTADLITCALEFGAIIANVDEFTLKTLQQVGMHIGTAFQIVDDILDVTAGEQKHGKTSGSDAANAKTTYVTLLGLEGSKEASQKLLHQTEKLLASLPYHTADLFELAAKLINRSY